jgi:predicted N-formylglutamate amidohydrolase
MHHHGTRRGLPHMLVEIRQDLVADAAREAAWAERLARILSPILADPELHSVKAG